MALLRRVSERLRRPQGVPWRSAGLVAETLSADEAVRSTGWVFDNRTGDGVSLASFVASGDDEVRRYLKTFGFARGSTDTLTITRAQDGTTAKAFSAGVRVELRLVKALLDDKFSDASGTAVAMSVALG